MIIIGIKREEGNVYGRLIVLEQFGVTKNGTITWKCKCQCGKEIIVDGASLRNGHTKSCGCLQKDIAKDNFKNIAGNRYGRLTAIKPTYKIKKESMIWECRCDCGNLVYKTLYQLQFTNVSSCGCLRKENSSKLHKKDLIGQRFGHLVVIKENVNADCEKITWLCKCDCGNCCIIQSSNLLSGTTKSCGCLRQKQAAEIHTDNLIGRIFGKLTVINKTDKRENGQIVWLCKCDCGNLYEATGAHLKDGHIQSCGCLCSKGEMKIKTILEQNNICFQHQYSFSDLLSCKNKKLRFDFAIFKNDELIGLIEFQGRQHYITVDYFGGEEQFKRQQEYDRLKVSYCKEKNIPLLIIPYTDYEQISIEYINKFFEGEINNAN